MTNNSLNFIERKYRRMNEYDKRIVIQEAAKGKTHKVIADSLGVGRSTVTKFLLKVNNSSKNNSKDINNYNLNSQLLTSLESELYKWIIETLETKRILQNPEGSSDVLKDNIDLWDNLKALNLNIDDILSKVSELVDTLSVSNFIPSYEWIYQYLNKINEEIRKNFDTSSASKNNDPDISIPSSVESALKLNELPSNYVVKSNVPENFQLKASLNSNANIINQQLILNKMINSHTPNASISFDISSNSSVFSFEDHRSALYYNNFNLDNLHYLNLT